MLICQILNVIFNVCSTLSFSAFRLFTYLLFTCALFVIYKMLLEVSNTQRLSPFREPPSATLTFLRTIVTVVWARLFRDEKHLLPFNAQHHQWNAHSSLFRLAFYWCFGRFSLIFQYTEFSLWTSACVQCFEGNNVKRKKKYLNKTWKVFSTTLSYNKHSFSFVYLIILRLGDEKFFCCSWRLSYENESCAFVKYCCKTIRFCYSFLRTGHEGKDIDGDSLKKTLTVQIDWRDI